MRNTHLEFPALYNTACQLGNRPGAPFNKAVFTQVLSRYTYAQLELAEAHCNGLTEDQRLMLAQGTDDDGNMLAGCLAGDILNALYIEPDLTPCVVIYGD